MRKLIYFTLGFSAACGLGIYADSIEIQLAGSVLIILLGAAAGKGHRIFRRGVLVLLGCFAGFAWLNVYGNIYVNSAEALDDTTQFVEIRVSEDSWKTDYGTAFDGILIREEKPYQVRVYLSNGLSVEPGDYVYGCFRFRLTTPGGESESVYHQGKGIFLLAYQEDSVRIEDYEPTKRDIPALLRRDIRNTISALFPEDTAPFAKALFIGDTTDLDYETDTNFKISGIRHIIAVSGLHVSILFALINTVTFRKRWVSATIGFPVLVLFAAVAGFTPSVNRACIMSGLMILGTLFDKEYDGPTALAFSMLAMLIVNPMCIASVSLQLSVASVAGIYLFHAEIRKWLLSHIPNEEKAKLTLLRRCASSISISLSAMVFTTPLCAWYFGSVSLIAPLTNMLTLWVVNFLFFGILGTYMIGLLHPGMAGFLTEVISWPMRFVLKTAEILSDIPMSAVYTRSVYIVLWLVFVYLLLFVFLFSSSRKPGIMTCCAVLGLCVALLAGWLEGSRSEMSFTVLDVGQGQCLLLQSEGRIYMVDCGGSDDTQAANIAAETLLSRGISKLDGVILTHMDRDHAGALDHVLSRIDTDLLILPEVPISLAEAVEVDVIYASEVLEIAYGETKIIIYPPTFPGNSNEKSLCILFDTKKCDILITGDRSGFGERALLRSAQIPEVDILVAGHHGSKHSTCQELLDALQPEIVCISAGEGNSYGHPSQEVLDRLYGLGCSVYRTDHHGTITIRR